MIELSIVIPVKDEEKIIPSLIERISSAILDLKITFEIIFVTDINKDHTVDVLQYFSEKNQRIKTIKLANCFGQHVAVMAGLDYSQGNYVVIMDGDLQDFPEDIPLLYRKITEGYDIVYAVKQKKNDSFFRNLSSRTFNSLMNLFSDIKQTSNTSMFRIISRKAVNEVIQFRENEPSLTYIFNYINLPTSTVKVRSGSRQEGKTKYNIFGLMEFAISSLLSFSRKPLKLISNLGLIMSFFSFLYFAIVIFQHFFMQIEILGWATIISIITFLGGIQLLSLGIIGEYVGRIYMQTKNRPLYIIEKKIGDFNKSDK